MNLPEQFILNMKDLLEDDYAAYEESFSQPRVYGLRVNTTKISVEEFLKISPFTLTPIPWTTNGFYYPAEERPGKHPYYFAGLYYLQEPSAMTPAQILPIEPGDRVLDTCAAPGGKSTELAAKLNGTGLLLSNDISNSRAQALMKNLELFGIKNSIICSEDPQKLVNYFPEYFDKILIDAPCSGEGMFRKEPAVIKSWVEHGNEFYVNLQKQITAAALKMLKPGGMLVYSTCTFAPCEDEDMVLYMQDICPELRIINVIPRYEGFAEGMPEKALRPEAELKKAIRIFPHKVSGEGHFVVLLQKGEKTVEKENPERNSTGILQHDKGDSSRTSIEQLPKEAQDFLRLCSMDFSQGSFLLRNDKLYFTPECIGSQKGIRILRSGLLIGECKKNRFEPSQAFAMALKKSEFKHCVDLQISDERVIKYLKCETLDLSDMSGLTTGWTLVCVDGFPLGFGKMTGSILKNKYLAGWRWQ